MFNKKIIVSADKITRALYENSCVTAVGGRQKMISTARMERKGANKPLQDDTCAYSSVFAPSETEIAGLYHSKNYMQRKKIRKKAVVELVQNNFDPKNCLFITLHFDAKTYVAEPSDANTEDNFELPDGLVDHTINLVALSNSLFSSPNESTELEPAAVEPELTISNEGYQNLDICYCEFKKFIKKMNYRYNGFKYVAVFARQKKTGNWHYHLVCNLNYIDFEELKKIWALGGVYIERIKNMSEQEKVIKYLEKNKSSIIPDKTKQCCFCHLLTLMFFWNDTRLVFPNTSGNIPQNRNIQKIFDRLLKKANIEHSTMHCLRHTYATRCFELNIDIKVISAQLGHASVKTTYDIYIHLIKSKVVKEVDKLGALDHLIA